MERVKTPIGKRIFDIGASLIFIILCSPLFVLICFLIVLEGVFVPASRGNIFYLETRISAGRPFKIFKFRIFKKEALERDLKPDNFIDTKKLEVNKNNLTYTGRFLKIFYLDELPQLFNILKGEMSLVGPRPTNSVNYEELIKGGFCSKDLIKAGLTGYFQVHKDQISRKNQEELDMEYVDFCRQNPGWRIVWEDIKILSATILTVLRAKGI